MTRAELVKIVDLVAAAWNQNHGDNERARTVRAWWRYLQDLHYGDVLNVVDRLVVLGGWPPKVGEVRRKVLDTVEPYDAPTVHEAWAQAADRVRAVEQGTEWPMVHPLVLDALQRHGGGRLDEVGFRRVYEQVLAEADEARLLPAMPEPFGEML